MIPSDQLTSHFIPSHFFETGRWQVTRLRHMRDPMFDRAHSNPRILHGDGLTEKTARVIAGGWASHEAKAELMPATATSTNSDHAK